MNITLIILGFEIIVILVAFGFWFFLRWKKIKRKSSDIELLLDTINNQETERSLLLLEVLKKNYSLDNQKAQSIADKLCEAEKQFLKQYIKQQIEATDLTDYYPSLCTFLDQYIALIPNNNSEIATSSTESIEQNIVNEALDTETLIQEEPSSSNDQEIDIESVNTEEDSSETSPESEPDWSDAFEESGDTIDQKELTSENKSDNTDGDSSETSPESETEPDWGDAFAESGDTIDDETNASYNSEINKQ